MKKKRTKRGSASARAAEHTRMGHEQLERGDVDGAMGSFLDALAAEPGHVPAMLSRLELLALHRENHVGAVAAGRVMRAHGIGGLVMASAFSYSLAALGENEEALEVIYEGLRTAPETETLWYNAACLHAKRGECSLLEAALRVATQLLPDNGAAARTDDDFSEFEQERWFLDATRPRLSVGAAQRPTAQPLKVLIAGQTRLAEALASEGHTVETRAFVHRSAEASALVDGLLSGPHERVFVVDDGSEAGRETERALAAALGRRNPAPPIALIVPT